VLDAFTACAHACGHHGLFRKHTSSIECEVVGASERCTHVQLVTPKVVRVFGSEGGLSHVPAAVQLTVDAKHNPGTYL
jgi:hypothetical protein